MSVPIEGMVRATTELALLLYVDGQEAWIPLSQIQEQPEAYEIGDIIEIEIPEWLAGRHGLI